jgi:hypothetical protein
MAEPKPAESGQGGGLALLSLLVGLATGGAVYGIIEYWGDVVEAGAVPATMMQAVVTFSAGWLLLAERGRLFGAIVPAAIIAAVLAAPTWFFASVDLSSDGNFDFDSFPIFFWGFVAAPLSFYLMLTLAKAAIETGAPPRYERVFLHGLTLPLTGGGAQLFAGLSLLLLYAWAALLKQMNVDFFSRLFDEPWFILPFLGAIGGLSIAMIRGQQSVLGALRFIILLFARIAMPIMAVFSVTFLAALAANGPDAIFDRPYPGGIMIGLAFAGMLIFNGVYQNGEGGPPPWWLRIPTIVAIAAFPVYAGFAAWAFWLRVDQYGLTPARIVGLAMNGLAFAYSFVLIAGLLTELDWKGKRWMPPVASLNTIMAALWVVVLIGVSSPLISSWAISAKSQERVLMTGKVAAKDFDFGYLRFRLGAPGEAALARIEAAASGRPDEADIRAGAARARAALSYWEYQNPDLVAPQPEAEAESEDAEPPADEGAQPGPMDLPFNPGDDPDTEQ